ncbi:IQ domain-containing protein K isoform X1 [Arapaima gigas]
MAKGRERKSLWQQICEEYQREQPSPPEDRRMEGQQAAGPAVQFLERTVFPVLLPGLEAMLTEAQKQCCLEKRRTRFSACDFLTEWLYNHNPSRVGQGPPVSFLEIPFVTDWLTNHPRPPTPLSLLLSEDEAAILIQSYWRGYKVRVRPDVQELREWQRELRAESRDITKTAQDFWIQQETRAGHEIEDMEGSTPPNSAGLSILVLSPTPQNTMVLSPTPQLTPENYDTTESMKAIDPSSRNMQSLSLPEESISLSSPLLSYK